MYNKGNVRCRAQRWKVQHAVRYDPTQYTRRRRAGTSVRRGRAGGRAAGSRADARGVRGGGSGGLLGRRRAAGSGVPRDAGGLRVVAGRVLDHGRAVPAGDVTYVYIFICI